MRGALPLDKPRQIRNICILAHVDHGKTTLSDNLVATNGIISSKLAGKIRYLDSRPDEQERGITMKSSAIALYFKLLLRSEGGEGTHVIMKDTKLCDSRMVGTRETDFLVNLIDSPGHVDFSSEVSVASRLCDGALVLIDAVEGVCTQTHAVLRQARHENVKPILVLNKIDRLIEELKLSPTEAYYHLNKIIEQANAIMATMSIDDQVQNEDEKYEMKKRIEESQEQDDSFDMADLSLHDVDAYFRPEIGNVIFSSAVDGWAFRTKDFAKMYASKLGFKEAALTRALWGEFYLDAKTKRVLPPKQLKGRSLKLMPVQFILENIWTVYDAVTINPNPSKLEKIVQSLSLKVLPRDLRSKDTKSTVRNVMSQWLPLSTTVLLAVIECLPGPTEAQATKLPILFGKRGLAEAGSNKLVKSIHDCDSSEEAPVVAYIAKIFSVHQSDIIRKVVKEISPEEMKLKRERILRERETAPSTTPTAQDGISVDPGLPLQSDPLPAEETKSSPDNELLLGFARIYSGTIRKGMIVNVLGPKYVSTDPSKHLTTNVVVERLFLLMGRELEEVEAIPAGNVFAIHGLQNVVFKTATISTTTECPSFGAVSSSIASVPILRVAVEATDPSQMPQLNEGLRLLTMADPCAEAMVLESGETVLDTAGELHLERCIRDLKERYAKVDLHVSSPIVPFRESIAPVRSISKPSEETTDDRNEHDAEDELLTKSSSIKVWTANRQCCITMRAFCLPKEIVDFLVKQEEEIKEVLSEQKSDAGDTASSFLSKLQDVCQSVLKVTKTLSDQDAECLRNLHQKLWAFGPKRSGSNLLLNEIPHTKRSTWPSTLLRTESSPIISQLDSSIHTGFQLATHAGPICAEPMAGVCFVVENVEVLTTESDGSVSSTLSGQVITCSKEACKRAFSKWSARLLLATFTCEIQATADVLGKVYAVLAKRRGRIVSEQMKDGTSLFSIEARLAVIESFGFCEDIRKKTSGAAQPQLVFAGWDMLDEDPFWVPTTEEELEDLGDKADRELTAKKYMEAVRIRKGMPVDRKLVEHAEKQKTAKVK